MASVEKSIEVRDNSIDNIFFFRDALSRGTLTLGAAQGTCTSQREEHRPAGLPVVAACGFPQKKECETDAVSLYILTHTCHLGDHRDMPIAESGAV